MLLSSSAQICSLLNPMSPSVDMDKPLLPPRSMKSGERRTGHPLRWMVQSVSVVCSSGKDCVCLYRGDSSCVVLAGQEVSPKLGLQFFSTSGEDYLFGRNTLQIVYLIVYSVQWKTNGAGFTTGPDIIVGSAISAGYLGCKHLITWESYANACGLVRAAVEKFPTIVSAFTQSEYRGLTAYHLVASTITANPGVPWHQLFGMFPNETANFCRAVRAYQSSGPFATFWMSPEVDLASTRYGNLAKVCAELTNTALRGYAGNWNRVRLGEAAVQWIAENKPRAIPGGKRADEMYSAEIADVLAGMILGANPGLNAPGTSTQ